MFGAPSIAQIIYHPKGRTEKITKVQSGTSQSHANARNWAKNIINVFHLVRDARLNISDKRNILTSALSKLYNSYDPMSLAKLST